MRQDALEMVGNATRPFLSLLLLLAHKRKPIMGYKTTSSSSKGCKREDGLEKTRDTKARAAVRACVRRAGGAGGAIVVVVVALKDVVFDESL